MHKVFDPLDSYLITAAVNELLSKGKVQAFIDNDKQSTPGVKVDLIVDVKDIALENGNLTLTPPKMPLRIVPDTEDVPLRVSKSVILVQHSVGMKFQGRFITRTGNPVDLSTASGMLESFTKSPTDSKRLIKHLKTLGFVINQDTT